MSKHKQKIIVVVGPNASGKSDLAVEIAKKFDGEIISADSRQAYKGLDIGSGKITRNEMRGVPHYLLDIASPKRTFTVAQYQKLARRVLQGILNRGKLPIIVGGTGLYIDVLLHNWNLPAVKPNPELRRKMEKLSADELFRKLRKFDTRRAKNIDRRNKRRLVRALEIIYATGQAIPKIRKYETPYDALKIGVKLPPEVLKKRIKARLLKRFKQGMIAEVKKLRTRGLSWQKLDNLGLEYRYISRYLRGLLSKEEMIEKLETEIWHYARRQMTWFKRDENIVWLNQPAKALDLIKTFVK